MTLPIGFSHPMKEDVLVADDAHIKLPVGMMLVGKYWHEETLLKAGDAWERSVDWKTVQP